MEIRTDFQLPVEAYREGLARTEQFHGHLCPGSFNGVKISLLAQKILGLPSFPDQDLIVITEIDRCLTDAIMIMTGCRLGRRTLKFRDWGKFAATFCSIKAGQGVRIAVRDNSFTEIKKILAEKNIDQHTDKQGASQVFWEFPWQLHFSTELLDVTFPEDELPGKLQVRVQCSSCRDFVMDGRHLQKDGRTLCRPCAKVGG